MRITIALLLILVLSSSRSIGEQKGTEVRYSGGSLTWKSRDRLTIFVGQEKIQIVAKKHPPVTIPNSAVNEISYGQDVRRRVAEAVAAGFFTLGIGALFALSKEKKHYIGIVWNDAGKRGGVVLQASKNDYRGLVVALEAATGRKAVDADAVAPGK